MPKRRLPTVTALFVDFQAIRPVGRHGAIYIQCHGKWYFLWWC
jgi:hypothetical protein